MRRATINRYLGGIHSGIGANGSRALAPPTVRNRGLPHPLEEQTTYKLFQYHFMDFLY